MKNKQECPNCGSKHTVTFEEATPIGGGIYAYESECLSCGHTWIKGVPND